MTNIFDVDASILVNETAEKLKGLIKEPPKYALYVKSGAGRERPPEDPDFWYKRSAAILRQVYLNGPVGVERLRVRYGNKKKHVVHRKHFMKAGGSIIRDSLEALEAAGFVKKTKKGRVIDSKGTSFLDKISNEINQRK